MDRLPYVYLLVNKETKKVYIGSRYGKGCHPSDLLVTYPTSSVHVKRMIETYGKDSFVSRVLKTFSDVDSCREYEHKLLRRLKVIKRQDIFINKTDNIGFSSEASAKGSKNRKPSKKLTEHARVMGLSNKGKKHSEETVRKRSQSLLGNSHKLGKKESEETRKRKSIARTGVPSGMLGKKHRTCSCIICGKVLAPHVLISHQNSVNKCKGK
jgi:hypothetical protein